MNYENIVNIFAGIYIKSDPGNCEKRKISVYRLRDMCVILGNVKRKRNLLKLITVIV